MHFNVDGGGCVSFCVLSITSSTLCDYHLLTQKAKAALCPIITLLHSEERRERQVDFFSSHLSIIQRRA